MKNTEQLNEIVQKRFIHRPYGYIMDYARPDDSSDIIPTAEECKKAIPNVLGWGTPCEDGAFFTGLYLYALCKKYEVAPTEKTKGQILDFCRALFLLCDVCKNDGCIARGVANDGKSHYPFSSEDQVGPFILGLWCALHSKATDEEMKNEIKKRLARTIKGLANSQWKVPTEWDGVTRGDYSGDDWRGAAKIIFCAKVGEELGLFNQREFEDIRNAHPCGSIFARYEIVSQGFSPDMIRSPGLIQFWIDVCGNFCVYELTKLDKEYEKYYKKSLESNGYAVLKFLDDYKSYDNEGVFEFTYNWRFINDLSRECTNAEEAMEVAVNTHGKFSRENPRRFEHKVVGNMLFAEWIALVSPDGKTKEYAFKKLKEALEFIDWESYCYSYVFLCEGAFYLYDYEKTKPLKKS